jgi:uncharacterized protein YfdQ (DUF2303 family)
MPLNALNTPLQPTTEAETVAHIAVAASLNERVWCDHLAVIPDGYTVKDLSGYNERPRRAHEHITVQDAESLRRYLARFDDRRLAVFAQPHQGRYAAVLDYHVPGSGDDSPAPEAHHGAHVVTLLLTPSKEWKVWTAHDKSRMGQVEFAEFLEEHADDVVEPAGAALLEAVQHVQAARNVDFQSKVDLDNGDFVFNFASETKGKGQVHLPARLKLGLRPYEGLKPYAVEARLRYRVGDQTGLQLWYQLINADAVKEDAEEQVLAEVEELAGKERVFVGERRHPGERF